MFISKEKLRMFFGVYLFVQNLSIPAKCFVQTLEIVIVGENTNNKLTVQI